MSRRIHCELIMMGVCIIGPLGKLANVHRVCHRAAPRRNKGRFHALPANQIDGTGIWRSRKLDAPLHPKEDKINVSLSQFMIV